MDQITVAQRHIILRKQCLSHWRLVDSYFRDSSTRCRPVAKYNTVTQRRTRALTVHNVTVMPQHMIVIGVHCRGGGSLCCVIEIKLFPAKLTSGTSCPRRGKAIPLQVWTGPEGSGRLRLPDIMTFGT